MTNYNDDEVQKILRLARDAVAEEEFTNRVLAIINRFFADTRVQEGFNEVIDARIQEASFNIELPKEAIQEICDERIALYHLGESNGSSQSG
jgi:hypothetical protein